MSELYLHIPFCNSKCLYCDFLSGRADETTHKRLIDAMIRELYYRRHIISDSITSIFIGGGTPSSIHTSLIDKLFTSIYKYYSLEQGAEITIEANPGTLSREKLSAYRAMGINRLSMGLQSANDDELKLLGRIHTFSDLVDNYSSARELGFENINIDIMQALPYQSMEKYRNTLEKVVALDPEHISSYSLIIEEGTELYKRSELLKHLPDEDLEREIYYFTNDYLYKNGYNHYEISNYAKSSYECKHNIGYWERENYIGIGIGAASLIDNHRFSNIRDLDKYICELRSYTERDYLAEPWIDKDTMEELTLEDKMSEYMYLGLRKIAGINSKDFYNTFGMKVDDVFGDVLTSHIQNALIKKTVSGYALTDKGIDISNFVLSDFV